MKFIGEKLFKKFFPEPFFKNFYTKRMNLVWRKPYGLDFRFFCLIKYSVDVAIYTQTKGCARI